jgi:hypothetical protein
MSTTIAGLPETLGADLVTLQRAGLSTEYLFDVYGIDESIARDTPERRAYVAAARVSLGVLRQMHFKPRNGTHFRLAGAILFELATAPACDRCAGAGCLRLDAARIQLVCPGCFGSGLRRASTTWRVNATDCHYTDFRDRLQGVYQVTLTLLAGLRAGATSPVRVDDPTRNCALDNSRVGCAAPKNGRRSWRPATTKTATCAIAS